MQAGAGRVEVHRALAHRGEGVLVHQAQRLGRRRRVHGDDVGLGQQGVERVVGGVVGVRVERDHGHAESLEAPLHRPAHRTEPDQPGGSPGDLPGPVALVRDRAAAVEIAGAHLAVGHHHVAGGGEQQGDGHLRDPVGVAPGRAQHRDAARRGAGDVDVGGVAAGRADDLQGTIEDLAHDEVGLADQDGGADLVDPLGQLGAVPDAQRVLVDPRVVGDRAQLLQPVEPFAPARRGDQRDRLGCAGGAVAAHR